MTQKIATGYEKLAIMLEEHIHNYTPPSWCVPISNVAHTQFISPAEAEALMVAHKKNSLYDKLDGLSENREGFKHWYIREAIKDYFTQKK